MEQYRFCPLCGHKLEVRHLFGADRGWCPACDFIHFRDPKLAVGALIVADGYVLLVRRGVVPRKGYWAMPSGFVEYDEQPRPALTREIREETGLEAEVGGIIDVYPIMDTNKKGAFLLFEARIIGGELKPGDDVSEVRWFPIDDIPWEEMAFPQLKEALNHDSS
ncbi:MAG TPA: NUDIX domain-containing protein [Caldilineales bacterium]|nr:NUDIX domain-containing protein [Caldilineales bacterium]